MAKAYSFPQNLGYMKSFGPLCVDTRKPATETVQGEDHEFQCWDMWGESCEQFAASLEE